MKISDEYLSLLKNAQAQLQVAQNNHAFVMQNLIAQYKLTSADSLDMETGEIIRPKEPKKPKKK